MFHMDCIKVRTAQKKGNVEGNKVQRADYRLLVRELFYTALYGKRKGKMAMKMMSALSS